VRGVTYEGQHVRFGSGEKKTVRSIDVVECRNSMRESTSFKLPD
jgi:hypothetical protein